MGSPHTSSTFADTKYVEMLALLAFQRGNSIAAALGNTSASKNATALPVAPGTTTSFSTPNLTRTGTGTYRMSFGCSFNVTVAGGVVNATILRDGVAIGGAPTVGVSGVIGEESFLSIEWLDTVPDALTHTYGIQITATGGGELIQIPIGAAFFVISEL